MKALAAAGSVGAHVALAMWMAALSAPPAPVPQQVIDVEVVASAPERPPDTAAQQLPKAPPLPVVASAMPKERLASKAHVASRLSHPSHHSTEPEHKAVPSPQVQAVWTKPVYNAAYLHNQPPAYPERARRRGAEGEVLLLVDVTAEGTARQVSISRSSGHDLLDQAAQNAVSKWTFIPASNGAVSVETAVEIPVAFRLEQ